MQDEKLTFTIEQTASLLGIGRQLCYEKARSGEIPVIRLGKRLLVPRAALEKMLADPNVAKIAKQNTKPAIFKMARFQYGVKIDISSISPFRNNLKRLQQRQESLGKERDKKIKNAKAASQKKVGNIRWVYEVKIGEIEGKIADAKHALRHPGSESILPNYSCIKDEAACYKLICRMFGEDYIMENLKKDFEFSTASLSDVMKTILPFEASIIIRRFGLDGKPGETLEVISKRYGLTRERIRQIEAKALRKLRHPTRSRRFWTMKDG